MNFCKAEGTGNDFIIINNFVEKIPEYKLSKLAKHLCDRHFSIGADGLMVVQPSSSENADLRMLFFNADGSRGEMCGNGARCIVRYGYEKGLSGGHSQINIETDSGIVLGEALGNDTYRIRMNPISHFEKVSLSISEIETECSIKTKQVYLNFDTLEISIDYLEIGTPGLPHAVINCKGISELVRLWKDLMSKSNCNDDNKSELANELSNLRNLARTIRNYKGFPKGANVNFYEEVEEEIEDGLVSPVIYLMTFERGVEDFTLACGTGSVATAYSIIKSNRHLISRFIANGTVENQNYSKLYQTLLIQTGGTLTVEIEKNEEKMIYLSGPANIVYEGIMNL